MAVEIQTVGNHLDPLRVDLQVIGHEAGEVAIQRDEPIDVAGLRCETGRFQEMMTVELVNEGPVTILLDSGKAF